LHGTSWDKLANIWDSNEMGQLSWPAVKLYSAQFITWPNLSVVCHTDLLLDLLTMSCEPVAERSEVDVVVAVTGTINIDLVVLRSHL